MTGLRIRQRLWRRISRAQQARRLRRALARADRRGTPRRYAAAGAYVRVLGRWMVTPGWTPPDTERIAMVGGSAPTLVDDTDARD